MNFSEFYTNEEQEAEMINEDLLTTISAKLGTSIANIFRKRKKINIATEYLKIFQPMSLQKYNEAINQLSKFYIDKTVPLGGKKVPKIYVKDIRQASISGPFFASLFASLKGGSATTGAEKNILSQIPNAADPKDENELYKSKVHQMDVSVYLLSNGGKISLWNIPKTGTDPDDKNFNAENRVYAIGSDDAGLKAFETIFGMSFQNWLVTQQYADIKAKQEKQEKEKQEKTTTTKEQREKTWVEIVELNANLYNKIIKIITKDLKDQFNKNVEKTEKIETSEDSSIELGNNYLFKQPRGWMSLYKTKEGKYKAAFTDPKIRTEFINNLNFDVQIPSGEKVVTPENIQFKDFYIGENNENI